MERKKSELAEILFRFLVDNRNTSITATFFSGRVSFVNKVLVGIMML